jgi:hypothetical protein
MTSELNELLFAKAATMSSAELEGAGRFLKTRMQDWYHMLPDDMCFRKDLPAPLYELQ